MPDIIHCPDCGCVLAWSEGMWYCADEEMYWSHAAIAVAILDVARELAELWS